MGSNTSTQASGETSEVAIAMALVISVIIIIVIAITIFVLFFTDKIPFIERYEILYEGETQWRNVNRYGDTSLKFVSYRLKEVREKRRQLRLERRFPPPTRKAENFYDSQSFGTEDNYSINAHSYLNSANERYTRHEDDGPLVINSDDRIYSPRSDVISENEPARAEKKKKRKKKKRQPSPDKEPRSLPKSQEGSVRSSVPDQDIRRRIVEERERELSRQPTSGRADIESEA